ncbi:hypothetical protein [Candidatus Poriferisodalis sp.]|uniref:hypothetical protein n=1 Tax=Candidatus Poriferisodalis sp. TaxID=3101277 RepID=UPI003B01B57E
MDPDVFTPALRSQLTPAFELSYPAETEVPDASDHLANKTDVLDVEEFVSSFKPVMRHWLKPVAPDRAAENLEDIVSSTAPEPDEEYAVAFESFLVNQV